MTNSPPQRAVRIIVQGRVQGVGFRWYCRERARRFSLSGWVQNRTDGSVEVHASGPEDVLARFLSDLRIGPKGSHVQSVTESDIDTTIGSNSELPFPFSIHR